MTNFNKFQNNLIIGIAIIILLGILAFFLYNPDSIGSLSQNTASTTVLDKIAVADIGIPPLRAPPAGFKEYRHLTYHFSLFYPDDLSLKEYKENGMAFTVTFQDETGEKGFQVFVVPYGESQVTDGRFKTDVPSGVRQEAIDIMIDGTRGTMFWSENKAMGETREVWFIHGGFLYEVTTYKNLDEWLSQIMQTWKFL